MRAAHEAAHKPAVEPLAAGYSAAIFMTADKKSVTNRLRSHASGKAIIYFPEAIGKIDTHGREYIAEEVDMGRIVGTSDVVRTTSDDDIWWARRPGRIGLSRFVRGRLREPTSKVTIVLLERRESRGAYLIISAWLGPLTVMESGDFRLLYDPDKYSSGGRRTIKRESYSFWDNHAFVLDENTLYLPETLTKEPPAHWGTLDDTTDERELWQQEAAIRKQKSGRKGARGGYVRRHAQKEQKEQK